MRLRNILRIKTVMRTPRKCRHTIVFLVLFVIGISYWMYHSIKHLENHLSVSGPVIQRAVSLKYVALHLDLKGGAPNIDYLIDILVPLQDFGVNALVLEYEDMFPYTGKVVNISTPFHYTTAQLDKFLTFAAKMNIELIPLVQTFGHMEYILKLEEFYHLREDPLYPDSICPSNTESLDLIREVLKQVIKYHQRFAPVNYIHIGCDEVYRIRWCNKCRKRRNSTLGLYVEHVSLVADMLKNDLLPNATIMIWDDMLRQDNRNREKSVQSLYRKYKIRPVYWDYTAGLNHVRHTKMYYYTKHFKKIWAASAFKGADGPDETFPNQTHRLINNLNWLEFMHQNKKHYNFEGIILTGWSRYTHFQPLCELLPLSFKTLIPILMLISKYRYQFVWLHNALFSLRDWDKISREYFAEGLHEINGCGKTSRHANYLTCQLLTEEATDLTEAIQAFEEKIRKAEHYLRANDIDIILKFGYIDMRILINFKLEILTLKLHINREKASTKKKLKYFYPENVYNEYLAYRIFVVKHKIERTLMLLSKAVGRNTSLTRIWPRGRGLIDDPKYLPMFLGNYSMETK